MNENLANKVCLITGATSGIGEESAKELNKMGAEIIFVAAYSSDIIDYKKN